MALYHLTVSQIRRSAGQSAIAAAAYRAGERLYSDYYGEYSDYTRKGGVICSEILLPPYAPPEYQDRAALWNTVEQVEKHPKAQLAYSFDIALQNELSMEENIALAREFVQRCLVDKGMIADFAIHTPDKEDGGIPNPHFHVMTTMRPINPDGTWGHSFHGRGAASITRILVEEKVPTPGWLNFQRYGTFANIYAGAPEEKAYAWTIAQVKSILKEETYIGHSVYNKQSNISFKNKKKVRKPKEEWYRVENTHEAIISEDVFRQVQEQIASRRRRQKDGTTQIFSGLVKCADCGWSLAYGENKQNKTHGYYHCSKNGQGLRQCSMHYIRYDVLYAYVLSRLQYWSQQAQQDEDKLLKRLLNASDKERSSARKKQASELKKAEKRKAEVDGLFAKMYEDWSAGRITEYNFNMLSEKYQGEQKELDEKIQQLHEAMEAAAQSTVDAEKWVGLMKQYVNPTELTAELLNTLIEKILVHEAVKGEDGSREQEVEIFYRFIGKID